MRFPRLLALAALLVVLPLGAGIGGADDESINKDWKEVKKGNTAKAKERAEFWEKKGVTGKDTFWIALMWEKANENAKAIAAFEAYLKVEGASDTNKETCFYKIMTCHAEMEAWDKAVAAGDALLKTYPGSKVAKQVVGEKGRILRQAGKDADAKAAFAAAAEQGYTLGLFDLVDMLMIEGDQAGAKAAIEKYGPAITRGGAQKELGELAEFVAAIGSAAPSLEKAINVGDGEPAKEWAGKPTLLFFAFLPAPNLQALLRTWDKLRKGWEEGVNVTAVTSYNKYDPFQKKVVEGLAPEQEEAMIKDVLKQEGGSARVLLVPPDTWAQLRQKNPGQRTLVDKDGKFRWVRTELAQPYDWYCTEMALKKWGGGTGPADGGGKEPAGGDEDMGGGGGE
jgi:tetratricopeptide (TPR) repeat protein